MNSTPTDPLEIPRTAGRELTETLKGGVIMDVVTPEQVGSPRMPARSP